jgi:hypothetical protein
MSVATTPLADTTFLLIREEPSWSTHGTAKTTVAVPFYGGNFGLRTEDPDRVQPHVDGDDETTFIVQDTRDVTGPMEVGLFPSLAKKLLDWAVYRSGSPKKGKSHATTIVYPGLFARRAHGVMVNTMNIDGSDGEDIRLTFDMIGHYEEILTGASIPAVGSYSFPGKTSMTFLNARFLWSIDNLSTEIVPIGLDNLSIQYSNNLTIGPHVEDRVNTYKDGCVEYVREGTKEVSGSVVALVDRSDLPTMIQNKYQFSLKVLAAHRDGSGTTTTGTGTAGNNVTINVTDSSVFTVGDVVRFDTADLTKRSVATITVIPNATSITVDTLDKDVASGDYVWDDAVEIKLASARVTSLDYDHTPGELVKVTVNFKATAETAGSVLLAYKAKAYTP